MLKYFNILVMIYISISISGYDCFLFESYELENVRQKTEKGEQSLNGSVREVTREIGGGDREVVGEELREEVGEEMLLEKFLARL